MLNVSMYHANVKCMYLTTLIIKQENYLSYLYLCACENYNNSVARFNILSLKRSKNLSCTAVFIFFFCCNIFSVFRILGKMSILY